MFVTTQHSQHDREAVISQGLRTRDHGPRTAAVGRSAAAYRLPPAAYRRRGVLLLVILSLLFMFVLIAVTYVLVTTRHLTISRQYGRMATTSHGQNPQQELDGALLQVLRGDAPTIDPATGVEHYRSPIGPHSLLEDLYGESVHFQLNFPAAPTANGQLLEISAVPDTSFRSFPYRPDDGFFAGLVLTMTSGPAKGLSTRIVWSGNTHASPAPNEVMFRVLPINNITPAANDKFIVNSRPFTGTGFGFNPESGRPTAMFDTDATPGNGNSIAWALLPNPLSYDPLASGNYEDPPFVQNQAYTNGNQYSPNSMPATVASYYSAYPNNVPPFGGIGGANEDYDAVDYQNMAMAWLPPAPSSTDPIIPSFHRPALVRYMLVNQPNEWNPGSGDENLIKRMVMLRPFGPMFIDGTVIPAANTDHPNFTGSSPNFDAVRGGDPTGSPLYTWDVDNDGDGVTDSVWLDLGAPVHSTPDGRLYKPLFAILCVDLDGRVNVNAHGNATQADPTFTSPIITTGAGLPLAPAVGGVPGQLVVGSGFGPADVYPGAVLTSGSRPEFMQRLLWGDTSIYEGRYGEGTGGAFAGRTTLDDNLSALRLFQYPPLTILGPPYVATPTLTSCMTPIDVLGRRVIGLDVSGQALFAPVPSTDANYPNFFANETLDDPYELDLSSSAPRPGSGAYAGASYYDNPFTVYELERILRRYDIDTPGLAPRLEKLIDTYLASDPTLARRLTTDSFDIPMPPVEIPSDMRSSVYLRSQGLRAFHVKDILRARIADGLGFTTYPLLPAQEQQLENQVDLMLSWDLRAGRRMNINRPLGDGRDSDGVDYDPDLSRVAYVVDEPTPSELNNEGQTTAANQSVWAQQYTSGVNFELDNGLYYGFDVNGDGIANQVDQGLMARQLMARHLYVLMMMLSNQGFYPPMLPNPPWEPMLPETLSDVQKRELLVRRVAQWAVNVVDFMDPDNIMTPFEYDLDPWDGWDFDGVIDDGNNTNGVESADDTGPKVAQRRVVWGCETPALLLTETLALHDRRVADTDKDPSGDDRGAPNDPPPVDEDLDQVLIPQGSAFIELYATHNPNAPVASGDLYTYDATAGWCLDLGRIAPAGDDGYDNTTPHSYAYPVWRLAISAGHLNVNSARNYAFAQPETVSFDPQPSLLPPPPAGLGPAHALYDRMCANIQSKVKFSVLDSPSLALDIPIERIVWFANPTVAPDTKMRDGKNIEIYYGRQFFNNPGGNVTPLLAAGRYALVGPRPVTPIGSRKVAGTTQKWGEPSDQAIRLDAAAGTDVVTSAGYPTAVTSQKPVLGIVAQVDKAVWNPAWTGPPIGISVSEPLPNNYYQQPTDLNPLNPNGAGYNQEAYDDLTTPTGTFIDAPFEKDTPPFTLPVEQLPTQTKTATTKNHRTVFLQRLANPLAPYHPLTNPYLTVDWMPIDLTVFNGEDHVKEHASWAGSEASWDPADSNPEAKGPNVVFFGSHQRGKRSSYGGTNSDYNIWSQWIDTSDKVFLGGEDPAATDTPDPIPAGDYNYFRHSLTQSSASNRGTLGYLNHGYGDPDLMTYIGEPERPFPWIAWNNRPYNSVYELMQVPASSPGRLYWEFGMADTTGTPPNPYNNIPGNPNYIRFPFRHLQNFFASANETVQPNFGRIFDYLEVPSPFVGTDILLAPNSMGSTSAGTDYLHPPFDSVSNFRDPGRVNINTIASEQVWNAVVGESPLAIDFAGLHTSRQGWLTGSVYPTDFACPFRSYSSGDMVPRLSIGGDVDQLRHRGVNLTLLRAGRMGDGMPDPNLNDPDDYPTPIFPALMDTSTIMGVPVGTPPPQYKDGYRNPYFLYQAIDRLGNLVTTHSNVYAVWVTVGYFEVTPWGSVDAAHPDGYQLGQELGMDTGDVERHRAFYIIDRSIPVGFERGQNHNVEKAVLLRRFIE